MKPLCLKNLSILLYFCCTCVLSAQDYLIEAELITTKDGLSGITTLGIEQDDDHFIWINTSQGLDRFDGSRFKFFSSSEYGLGYKLIHRMEMGQDNLLWIIDRPEEGNLFRVSQINNFAVFDTKTQETIPEIDLAPIRTFLQAEQFYLPKSVGWPNRVFFTNQAGDLWTYQENSFHQIQQKLGEPVSKVISQGETLIVSVGKRLLKVDLSGGILQSADFPEPIMDMWLGDQDTIWLSTRPPGEQEIVSFWKVVPNFSYEPFYLTKEGKREEIPINLEWSDKIYRTSQGIWLVVSLYNDYLYDPKGVRIANLADHFSNEYSFTFRKLLELDNSLLIATSGGLIRLKVQPNLFKLVHSVFLLLMTVEASLKDPIKAFFLVQPSCIK